MNKKSYKILSLKLIFLINIFTPNNFFINKLISSELNLNPSIDYLKKRPSENFYILGPGDTLKLKVSENTSQLNSVFTINGEGYAYLKRLKKVYLKGLTIEELRNILNEGYAEFVKDPDVELDVLRYRPIKIYIDGEVETPGQHLLDGAYSIENNKLVSQNEDEGIISQNEKYQEVYENNPIEERSSIYFPTLVDIIRASDGLTSEANLKEISITRKNRLSNGGGRLITKVNLLKVINLEDSSQNIRIYDGDTIYVSKGINQSAYEISKAIKSNINPSEITVFVGGRVELPGKYKISRSSALNDAINISGGTRLLKGPVKLIRNSNNGKIINLKFNHKSGAKRGTYRNPFLKNGDIIFVGKSNFNIATELLNEVTSPLQSLVSIYGIYKVFD